MSIRKCYGISGRLFFLVFGIFLFLGIELFHFYHTVGFSIIVSKYQCFGIAKRSGTPVFSSAGQFFYRYLTELVFEDLVPYFITIGVKKS